MALYFTNDHEWIDVNGSTAKIGITDHAQEQLGDLVYVELPEVGDDLKPGDQFAVVESVKAASEVYAPITGNVTEINEKAADEPSIVNNAAEGDGWLIVAEIADPSELEGLMNREAYDKYVAELEA